MLPLRRDNGTGRLCADVVNKGSLAEISGAQSSYWATGRLMSVHSRAGGGSAVKQPDLEVLLDNYLVPYELKLKVLSMCTRLPVVTND